MDGKAVLARAREFYKGPIIVLSARDREAEKIAALDLGANDYVEKPFGVGELLGGSGPACVRRLPRRRPWGRCRPETSRLTSNGGSSSATGPPSGDAQGTRCAGRPRPKLGEGHWRPRPADRSLGRRPRPGHPASQGGRRPAPSQAGTRSGRADADRDRAGRWLSAEGLTPGRQPASASDAVDGSPTHRRR